MPMVDSWELYKKTFNDGDEVVIITELDKVVYGKLETTKIGCYLKRRNRGGRLVHGRLWLWDQIRFMANDGFPCAQLLGADGNVSIEKEKSVQWSIRTAFEEEYGPTCTLVLGDPFIIEGVNATLYNSGNSLGHYDELDEEVLVMTARDGAKGCLWDLSTVFHFS